MEEKTKICENKTYYCLALDPIHVGTGGYRIGRVDNTIMREPGTDLPKIPGTSLCGVARAYTAMQFSDKYQRVKKDKNGKEVKDKEGRLIYESCAGKGGTDGEGHCGEGICPVCIPYGFTKRTQSLQGMAQFSDARILFFPVYSMAGPVWVTSPGILKEFRQEVTLTATDKIRMVDSSLSLEKGDKKYLNLGWFMLELEGDGGFEIDCRKLPDVTDDVIFKFDEIAKRLILVSDELFPQIVNDNLEVRTSVSIDPQTGAAESGALFTYEAIPRATVLSFSIIYNNPQLYLLNNKPLSHDIEWVEGNVQKGLRYMEFMGIGGMGTRGMGRMRILSL